MQDSTFLVLLRLIFAQKMTTAPPTGLGSRSCEGLPVIWTRKVEFFFLERTLGWSGEVIEFWLKPFFFGDHQISAGKTVSILVKTFFLEIT